MFSKFDDSELIVNLFFLKGEHVDIKFICKYEDKIWQTDGETIETVRDFILGGSQITADGDCSHEIKRPLLLGRKAMINLDSILKSRDTTFPKKVHLIKAIIFQ